MATLTMPVGSASAWRIAAKLVEPAAPIRKLIPYSRNADEKTLRRKYLAVASRSRVLGRDRYNSTYVGMLISSSETKSAIKSLAAATRLTPATMNKRQASCSPG